MNNIEVFFMYDNNQKTTMNVMSLTITEKHKNISDEKFLKMI